MRDLISDVIVLEPCLCDMYYRLIMQIIGPISAPSCSISLLWFHSQIIF